MKRLLVSVLLFICSLYISSCSTRTLIVDWVIFRVTTPEVKLEVNVECDLYDHNSLATDKITILFDEYSFTFVDYYNNTHTGIYSREKGNIIKMYFENGEVVDAQRNVKNIAYSSDRLIFSFIDIEYEFYEVCDEYPKYSTEELEKDLRDIGSKIREVYENETFDCEYNSNYCVENICRSEIVIEGDNIILRCLNNKYPDIDITNLLEQKIIHVLIYEIDNTNLIKKSTDIKPGICIFRPKCSVMMAIYFFKE